MRSDSKFRGAAKFLAKPGHVTLKTEHASFREGPELENFIMLAQKQEVHPQNIIMNYNNANIPVTPSAAFASFAVDEQGHQHESSTEALLGPESYITPRLTRYSSASPPTLVRERKRVRRSKFTLEDGDIQPNFLIPLLNDFEEHTPIRLLIRRQKQQLFLPSMNSLSMNDSFSSSSSELSPKSTVNPAVFFLKANPPRRTSLTLRRNSKVERRNSGSALAA